MKMRFINFGCFLWLSMSCFAQQGLDGVWQGVLLQDGKKNTESELIYVLISAKQGDFQGKTREEAYNTAFYAIQKTKGKISGNAVDFKQTVIESKKSSSKITWCTSEFSGKYVDSTGYITGTYKSSTCKRVTGKFVLYRSKIKFQEGELAPLGHIWRDQLLDDLKNNRKAPEIREAERLNFKFQPVYFDYDQAEIKPEYHAYLTEMIRVVNGHSDLRIMVTGHTDADGSNAYNEDLSKRRAESIKQFFSKNGLDLKRLEIDFKGETQPIDSNQTPEGKQHNRRVDFKFI